jgi:hypothetical protein
VRPEVAERAVRQTERVSSRNPSILSFQPFRLAYENDASWRLATSETRHGEALVRLRPVQAPPSLAAHHLRPSAGAETTPTVTSPLTIRPISVAQTGTPRT